MPCRVATAVTTDEIYERYLRKAITEINRLSHEIAQAADGAPTALPTGHPLASIFLLKYGPQAQELQEGVAFHGRAGNALIKSLQRLHVDPMEVYGTNCRQVRRLRPRRSPPSGCAASCGSSSRSCVVVMGDDALEFLNGIGFPLSPPVESYAGRAAALHADDRGARRPRHRPVARRGTREDRVLERLQGRRALVGRFAALLGAASFAAARSSTTRRRRICGRPGLWWDVAWLAFVLIPAVFALVLLALPLRERAVAAAGRARVRRARGRADARRRRRLRELRAARRGDAARLVVPRLLRDVSLGRAGRVRSSRGSTRTRCGAARRSRSSRTTRTSSTCSRSRSRSRASTRPRTSACPTCSSSRSSSAPPRGSACACSRRVVAWSPALGVTIARPSAFDLSGLPALPGHRARLPRAERRPALAAPTRAARAR